MAATPFTDCNKFHNCNEGSTKEHLLNLEIQFLKRCFKLTILYRHIGKLKVKMNATIQ